MEKRITLKEITLSNWRGINQKVTFGERTRISGFNGTGKSSIMKAWYWLLTSYPHPCETANFDLFNSCSGVTLSPDTPKACVMAVIDIDGCEYTLERRAEAKFTRKRSTNEYEKASADSYEIYLDSIETSATDFRNWIEANICPSDMLRYCIDGGFFINLAFDDKKKARKTLETIIGEIKNEDMKGDYSLLAEDMKKYTVEQIEERTKAQMKPVNSRMTEIPAIIEDKEFSLAEYDRIDFAGILADIDRKKADIANIDDRILGNGKMIEPIMGKRNHIFELINEKTVALNEARMRHERRESEKIRAVEKRLNDAIEWNEGITARNERTKAEYERDKAALEAKRRDLERFVLRRKTLMAERDEIKAKVFVAESCAYCGQELPADKQEELRERFNERKKRDIDDVVSRGKRNTEEMDLCKDEIARLESATTEEPVYDSVKDTSDIQAELADARKAYISFESTEEYSRLAKDIEDLKAGIPELPANDNEELTSAKTVLMNELDALNRKYGIKAKADDIRGEITALKDEQRKVGATLAALEGKLAKCKEYVQEKNEIISYRVNGRMTDTTVDMWSKLKDGTLVPDMVLKGKNGIKYPSLNFAQQIKTSVEIQCLFMSHYDISLPVFIDEASVISSSNLPDVDAQTVMLYANDNPTLNVEQY